MSSLQRCTLLIGLAIIIAMAWVSAPQAKPILLRYSCGLPPLHALCSKMMPRFKSEIEKRAQGKVKIELYPGAQLYKNREVTEAVCTGAVDIALNSAGNWAGRNPVFSYSNYFFLVRDDDHWLKTKDGILPILERMYEKQGAQLLHFTAYGLIGIASVKPIKTSADLKGKKIRAPIPPMLESLAALGATPTRISSAEVYDAIAKGAVEGATNSYGGMNKRKYYEVAKYAVGPTHWDSWFTTINLRKWKSLPKDVQKTIMQVSGEMAMFSIDLGRAFDQESREVLKKKGMTLTFLGPKEVKEWTAKVKPAHMKWIEQCEKAGYGNEARQIMKALGSAQ